MISCENVVKKYTNKKVLDGIDIKIERGQIFGLLGPSGAGKTTIIKILTGQLAYDGGKAKVFGKPTETLTGKDQKRIGIMMDEFGIYDRLTCEDNLKIFADIYNIPYERIEEILKEVGLTEARKRSAANLSKGMRARLQLARVFMHSPELIFLDEPTSGLDPQSMRAIHKIIQKKKAEGCTIFLTTHNMEEATKLCDNVALLNEGVIVEYGNPKGICRKYNHQREIVIHLTSGLEVQLAHDGNLAENLFRLMQENEVETMHSTEPSLETVFLQVTGRKLQEEE